MPVTIDTEVAGLKEVQAEMERIVKELHGSPMLNAMRRATLLVTASAKRLVPVDSGRLRASITPEVRNERNTVVGVVGSNVVYAPYVETGTRPHWPPPGALAVWAKRHGMTEATIRYIIGTRGTKKRPYLMPAFERNEERIRREISNAVGGIIE